MQKFITLELVKHFLAKSKIERGENLKGLSLQSFFTCCVTADPMLNFDPWPRQWSVMRGSCLTQNGAWFRSQKVRERDMHRMGERGRELHRGLIYSLSLSLLTAVFFLSLLCFLFCLHRNCCPFFLYISSLFPPSSHPHLTAFGQRHAISSGHSHHHHHRYGFMTTRTSRILGGNLWDKALMRIRPHCRARNVCKWYAHTKRTLGRRGERQPSSHRAQRKMSGSGQKNDNKIPPPFSSSISFSLCCI